MILKEMGYNYMVEDATTAMDHFCRGDHTSMPVEGGYMVLEWSEYYRRIEAEAESLYDVGWRSTDPDIVESLILTYVKEDNNITREWAENIKAELVDIEEAKKEE